MFGKKLINTEVEYSQPKKQSSVNTLAGGKKAIGTRNQTKGTVNMGQMSSSGSSGSA
jgi:hypothetical protein